MTGAETNDMLPMNPERHEADDAQVQYGLLSIFVHIGQTPFASKYIVIFNPAKVLYLLRGNILTKLKEINLYYDDGLNFKKSLIVPFAIFLVILSLNTPGLILSFM